MKKNILTESIHKILNEEIRKQLIKESFNSRILQQLYNQHNGINLNDFIKAPNGENNHNNTKYILSYITDEMIDKVYNSIEEYQNQAIQKSRYDGFVSKPFFIPFNDGTIVTLKEPTSVEGKKLFDSLCGGYGKMWTNQLKKRYPDGRTRYDDNYVPSGGRASDYMQIMKNAKNNGYRISDIDRKPENSIYNYGSNLNRYYDYARLSSNRPSLSDKDSIEKGINKRNKYGNRW